MESLGKSPFTLVGGGFGCFGLPVVFFLRGVMCVGINYFAVAAARRRAYMDTWLYLGTLILMSFYYVLSGILGILTPLEMTVMFGCLCISSVAILRNKYEHRLICLFSLLYVYCYVPVLAISDITVALSVSVGTALLALNCYAITRNNECGVFFWISSVVLLLYCPAQMPVALVLMTIQLSSSALRISEGLRPVITSFLVVPLVLTALGVFFSDSGYLVVPSGTCGLIMCYRFYQRFIKKDLREVY